MDTTTTTTGLALKIHRAAQKYAVAAEAVDDLVRYPDPDEHIIYEHHRARYCVLLEACAAAGINAEDVITETRHHDGPEPRDVWLVVDVLPAHRIVDLIAAFQLYVSPTSCPTCGSSDRRIYGPPCGERLVGGTFPNADEWHIEFALAA